MTPDSPQTPDASLTPDTQQIPDATMTPNSPQIPDAKLSPDSPQIPDASLTLDVPRIPDSSLTPDAPQIANENWAIQKSHKRLRQTDTTERATAQRLRNLREAYLNYKGTVVEGKTFVNKHCGYRLKCFETITHEERHALFKTLYKHFTKCK